MAITVGELEDILMRSVERAPLMLEEKLLKVGEAVKTAARDMIGHEHDTWPALAESTIAEKERKVFDVPDPLLRTGQLRDSIEMEAAGLTMSVGSTEKIAAYQEMGTSRIPPRPFIAPSAEKGALELERELGEQAILLLTPAGTLP